MRVKIIYLIKKFVFDYYFRQNFLKSILRVKLISKPIN